LFPEEAVGPDKEIPWDGSRISKGTKFVRRLETPRLYRADVQQFL
jgi:hypothetical protein